MNAAAGRRGTSLVSGLPRSNYHLPHFPTRAPRANLSNTDEIDDETDRARRVCRNGHGALEGQRRARAGARSPGRVGLIPGGEGARRETGSGRETVDEIGGMDRWRWIADRFRLCSYRWEMARGALSLRASWL